MATLGMSNGVQSARTNGRNSTSSIGYASERATLAQSSAAFGNGGWNPNIWTRSPHPGLTSTMAENVHAK
ncbi:hypothetical protein FQN49_008612, partial [Arthroderma sp. PD_2]